MRHRQTGFSLVEALVSLLVLSIGWLGLGQLQARLSLASLNQSNMAYARLVQSVYYEKTRSYGLSGVLPSLSDSVSLPSSSGTYNIQLSRSSANTVNNTMIRVEWKDTDRPRSEIISLSLSTYPTASDTRWLLITP